MNLIKLNVANKLEPISFFVGTIISIYRSWPRILSTPSTLSNLPIWNASMVELQFLSAYPNITAICYLCMPMVLDLVTSYLNLTENSIKKSSEYSKNILKIWTVKHCVSELINTIDKLGQNLYSHETIKNLFKLFIIVIRCWLALLYFNYFFFIYDILDNLLRIRYITRANKFNPIFIHSFAIIIFLFSIFNALSVMYMFYIAPFDLIQDSVMRMIMYVISRYVVEKVAIAICRMSHGISNDLSLANNYVYYINQYRPFRIDYLIFRFLVILLIVLLDIISSKFSVMRCITMLAFTKYLVEALKISPILDEDSRKSEVNKPSILYYDNKHSRVDCSLLQSTVNINDHYFSETLV